MLTEPDVIRITCDLLKANGYIIRQALGTSEKGDDIVAVKETEPVVKLHVEAKGATSSKSDSNRFGKPFNNAQVRDHVAMAFYKASEMLARNDFEGNVRVGIALPKTDKHIRCVERIKPILRKLGIAVFWAHEEESVEVESPWKL